MHIEDILVAIHDHLIHHINDPWSRNFVTSVTRYIRPDRTFDKPLSVKQAQIILKLAQRLRALLVSYELITDSALQRLLIDPTYYYSPYESQRIPNEVRYLGDNLLGFRFKHQELLVQKIKGLDFYPAATNLMVQRIRFDWPNKLWIVPIHQETIDHIEIFIRDNGFHMDQLTRDYMQLCRATQTQPSSFTYAPHDPDTLIVNICNDDIFALWITEVADGIKL